MPNTEDANPCPSIFHERFADAFLIERILLVIYTLIFFIGLVGNLMTIIIIKYNKYLRTPTNFYLLNLAVSDLMILMCNLPLEMMEIHYRQWPLSIGFCRLRNISAEFFTCSSILTILAFTCERYFAIVHPIHFHQLSHLRRAKSIILAIWFISLIFSVPFGFSYEIDSSVPAKLHRQTFNATSFTATIFCRSCVAKPGIEKLLSIVMIITSFGFFYLPMLIIGAIYFFIAKALRRVNQYENPGDQTQLSFSSLLNKAKRTPFNTPSNSSLISRVAGDVEPNSKHIGSYSWLKTRARCQARKVVVKTLVAVVIAFFVCYAPLYLQRLLLAIMQLTSSLNADVPIFSKVIAYLYVISGATFYFGSVINPILYNVVSNKYRRAFHDLFCCRLACARKTNLQHPRTIYHIHRTRQQAVHYFVKKPPLTPPSQAIAKPLQNKLDCHSADERQSGNQEEILMYIPRPLSLNSQSSRSNSSLISSSHRRNYSNHSLNSHASLRQECQVVKQKKFSLRRQLLLSKQPTGTMPSLLTKDRV